MDEVVGAEVPAAATSENTWWSGSPPAAAAGRHTERAAPPSRPQWWEMPIDEHSIGERPQMFGWLQLGE